MWNLISCVSALAGAVMLAVPNGTHAAGNTNIALEATAVSASVNSHLAYRINDNGRTAFWSGYHGSEYYGNYEYVELDWDRSCTITNIIMLWAESGDTIAVPTDAYVEYYDGVQWVKSLSLGAVANRQSRATVNLSTQKIRVYMKGERACGVREARVFGELGEYDPTIAYEWKNYSSNLDYNYKRDYPNGVPAPTKMLPENNGQVGMVHKGWWAFAWGPKRSHYVTDEAIDNLLDRMNKDFGYFRDTLGWLPDKRARRGYYSTVYLYGSGLNSDPADSTDRGGWQGATWYNGETWPMVNLSYYPVACFDKDFTYDKYYNSSVTDQTAQQGACVHEGIHAVFADLEGCKNAAWFQESGNTSMQADAELSRTPNATPTSMGFLSAANMIAPFIPIECYSGWLQDGTFGGPSAEGVNRYNSRGDKMCTWRNLLGGYQYGELFAHFLGVRFGTGSLPWIWRYCKNRVLDGIADSLGEEQTRRLVLEYRAKQAMIDFGKWTTASIALLDNNWKLNVIGENTDGGDINKNLESWTATCYARMTACDEVDSAGWWKPEYRTTPGWSGANFVPLHVEGDQGNIIRIHFKPFDDNMVCLLCYRSKRGRVYYSHPVEGEGNVSMMLQEKPANNVVTAVVCNTDYIYVNDKTRSKHYDYRLQMLNHVFQPADPELKWYKYRNTINDRTFDPTKTDIETAVETDASAFRVVPETTVATAGQKLALTFKGVGSIATHVYLFNEAGERVGVQTFLHDGDFNVPAGLQKGVYILKASDGRHADVVKLFIK